MNNMFDYLKYYNNLDVQPLIEAITKHRAFYYEKNLDMHKDAISLSGLAEKIMFSVAEQSVDKKNRTFDLYDAETQEKVNADECDSKTKKVYHDKVYLISEKHKKCFELCRQNNVGVLLLVFIDIMKKMLHAYKEQKKKEVTL